MINKSWYKILKVVGEVILVIATEIKKDKK